MTTPLAIGMIASIGPAVQPDYAAEMARLCDDAGVESLWTVEHVVVPTGYESAYPYSSSGRMPGDREDIPIPDPLIWLAYAAAVTTRVKLATGVLILPEHNPVLLAKQVATLDHMAGGRVILGVGVGWLREEFDAIGVPFEERGARADDHIEALRVLWRDAEPTFNGPFTRFERAQCWPKPVQPGGVPIVIGGSTKPAARRAGRLGDGFFPFRISPDELAGLLDVMGAAAKDAGRDPAAIEITTSGSADLDTLKRLVDLGVTRVVYPPLGMDLATLREQLDRLTGDLIAKV